MMPLYGRGVIFFQPIKERRGMLKTENKLKTKRILIEGQGKLSEILEGKGRKEVEADHQASVELAVERMCLN